MTPTFIIVYGRYIRVRIIGPNGYRALKVQSLTTGKKYTRRVDEIKYDFAGTITELQPVSTLTVAEKIVLLDKVFSGQGRHSR